MSTLEAAARAFGQSLRAKLSSAAIDGEPEDQLRAPIERLVADLASLCGLPDGALASIGETALGDLKTRPDYAITVHKVLAGFLAGVARELPLRHAAQLGCALATVVLDSLGTQEYKLPAADLASRIEEAYGTAAARTIEPLLASLS